MEKFTKQDIEEVMRLDKGNWTVSYLDSMVCDSQTSNKEEAKGILVDKLNEELKKKVGIILVKVNEDKSARYTKALGFPTKVIK